MCVCARFLLLLNSYSLIIYKRVCVCMCVRVELLFCLSLRHRTIFYIGTLLILMVCVCVRAHAGVSAFGCCFVSANELLVDICQYCCLLMFVCLPL